MHHDVDYEGFRVDQWSRCTILRDEIMYEGKVPGGKGLPETCEKLLEFSEQRIPEEFAIR